MTEIFSSKRVGGLDNEIREICRLFDVALCEEGRAHPSENFQESALMFMAFFRGLAAQNRPVRVLEKKLLDIRQIFNKSHISEVEIFSRMMKGFDQISRKAFIFLFLIPYGENVQAQDFTSKLFK